MLPIVEEVPFTKIGEAAYLENLIQIRKSDIIIITNIPIGTGNMKNLQSAYEGLKLGKPVYYIQGNKDDIDYTNGKATELINKMQSKGLIIIDSLETLMNQINNLNKN